MFHDRTDQTDALYFINHKSKNHKTQHKQFHSFIHSFRFTFNSVRTVNFKDSTERIAMLVSLKYNLTQEIVNVAVTHLYWNEHAAFIKVNQARATIEAIQKLDSETNPSLSLLCGDFNSIPKSEVLKLILGSGFHTHPIGFTTNSPPFMACIDYICQKISHLTSFENEKVETNKNNEKNEMNKNEKNSGICGKVENGWTLIQTLAEPSLELVQPALPNESLGSDHLPVYCVFERKFVAEKI